MSFGKCRIKAFSTSKGVYNPETNQLQIQLHFENYEKTVTFQYDLVRDTVEGVATEMLKELEIDKSY